MREHAAIQALESEHRCALDELATKHARTRERTLQLIDDRNKEISRLRALTGAAAVPGGAEEDGAATSDDGVGGGGGAAAAAFVMEAGGRADSGALVHEVLEATERGKELAAMRREIRELEGMCLSLPIHCVWPTAANYWLVWGDCICAPGVVLGSSDVCPLGDHARTLSLSPLTSGLSSFTHSLTHSLSS